MMVVRNMLIEASAKLQNQKRTIFLNHKGISITTLELNDEATETRSTDAVEPSLVGSRRTNRPSSMAITVSTRPMTSEEEAGAAEALVGLVARLIRERLQHKEK